MNDNITVKNDELELDLLKIEFDDLDISDFVDEELMREHEGIAKVMAASCTTCECCCSCSSI